MASLRSTYDPRHADTGVFAALLAARKEYGGKKIVLHDADDRKLTYDDIVRAVFALGAALLHAAVAAFHLARGVSIRHDFGPSTWDFFWQNLLTEDLRVRAVESLWHLHAQPPLWNALNAPLIKLFGNSHPSPPRSRADWHAGIYADQRHRETARTNPSWAPRGAWAGFGPLASLARSSQPLMNLADVRRSFRRFI